MAWEISYIGSGKYTIESMLNPGYYLTVSSAGVALEFLDSDTLPNKALFTISQSGSGIYVIKSETNHYLAKNSSTDTIGTATSALERAKWRMCLKSEYVQFEELDCKIPIFKDENTTLSMLNQHTWDTIDDFTAFTVSSTTVTLNGATVTCNDEGTVTLNSTHIPTGTTCSIELFTPSIDMKNSNTAINNTLNRTKVWEYIRLYCNDGTISTTVNDDYVLFNSDCTNFASQCLYYGGMAFNGNPTNYVDALLSFQDSDKWYYNDSYGTATVPNQDRSGISYTWSAAENFRQYWGLRNSTTIGNCYRYAEYSSGSDMSDAIVYWQGKLKKGDIVQIFKSDGTATHTMIVSEIADNDIWVSYHSENKYNQSLTALATSETYMNVPFCIIQIAQ